MDLSNVVFYVVVAEIRSKEYSRAILAPQNIVIWRGVKDEMIRCLPPTLKVTIKYKPKSLA